MKPSIKRAGYVVVAAFSFLAIGACSLLQPVAPSTPNYYSLDQLLASAAAAAPPTAPTLIVSAPQAAPGYDSPHIIYTRSPHQLEYFAHSQWIDPPARMLAPLLVATIEKTGAFRAVVLTPSTAAGDLRLDTEIIRLQQEVGTMPGLVRFTLRANLIDENTRRILGSREFETVVEVGSDTPYGGVLAANQAVQSVLAKLAEFCVGAISALPAH